MSVSATKKDPIYEWMHDLLLMILFVPEKEIVRQATARDGIWNSEDV
jgi:hypothetical protein